jgi:beta-mannosidase
MRAHAFQAGRAAPGRRATWLGMGLLAAWSVAAQEVVVPQNDGWMFRQLGTQEWRSAEVPGEVHLDLLRHRLIPDPYRDFNADSVQWIGQRDWEYRRTLRADGALLGHDSVNLVFKGLDTFAEVYLNGSLLGDADNMFRSWSWPVKQRLKAGDNELRVVFRSAIARGRSLCAAYSMQLPADSDPTGASPYVRKAAYQFGWDFAPPLVGCGIWQPVELHAWDQARIAGLRFEQVPEGNGVRITIRAEIGGQAGTLQCFVDDELLGEHHLSASTGMTRPIFACTVGRERLWWPAGNGPQTLHHLRLVLLGREGEVLGTLERHIGFRTVQLLQEPDSIGRSFTFAVNGVATFMKGANVVPPDLFPSRAGDSAWVALVRHAQRAHMNMLRVWAGGIYPPDAFFAACDTAGILVWQDLLFANLVPAEGNFLENVRMEAREQCGRIALHPSAALFCGNNELEVAWNNWGWQAKYGLHGADSMRVIQSNRELWQRVLAEEAQHSGLPYTWTSPLNNWGNAAGLRNGDLHYWGVWHGDEPLRAYARNVGRFVSEYGFQSWPDSTLLAKYMDPNELHLGSAALAWRQRSYKTDAPIWKAIEVELGERPRTLGGFIEAGQRVQAKAYRLAMEAHMAARPRCMGTLLWQLNDCWPGPSWSLIDYQGHWKPAMEEVQRLYGR